MKPAVYRNHTFAIVGASLLLAGCGTGTSREQASAAVDTYSTALTAATKVYGDMANDLRAAHRNNALSAQTHQIAFRLRTWSPANAAPAYLAPPDRSFLICDPQESRFSASLALGPLGEIAKQSKTLTAKPKKQGFSLLIAAVAADFSDKEKKDKDGKTKAKVDPGKTALANCKADFTTANARLKGTSDEGKQALTPQTVIAGFELMKKFFTVLDGVAGQIGAAIFDARQKKAFRDLITHPDTKAGFDESVKQLKGIWTDYNRANRMSAAEDAIITHLILNEAYAKAYANLKAPYVKLAAAADKAKTAADQASAAAAKKPADKKLKKAAAEKAKALAKANRQVAGFRFTVTATEAELTKTLKKPTERLVKASTTYDGHMDQASLAQVKTLEKAFADLVKKAKNDDFSFDKVFAAFDRVKTLYEEVDKAGKELKKLAKEFKELPNNKDGDSKT